MKRGNCKKTDSRVSLMLIPHSGAGVKVLSLRRFYLKLLLLAACIIASAAFVLAFAFKTHRENSELKTSISTLSDINKRQLDLLAHRASQIEDIKLRGDEFDLQIRSFMQKYREITDNYISGRMATVMADRSGTSIDRAFLEDLKELEALLKSLQESSFVEDEGKNVLIETEKEIKDFLASMPTLIPLKGEITSNFGWRKDPITKLSSYHDGIDIAGNYGATIVASGDGKVVFAGKTKVYGNTVIIDHGHGISTLYGHASRILIKNGQTVRKGQAIALVGNTGRSTGTHLHFGVLVNGTPVDPMKYLDK